MTPDHLTGTHAPDPCKSHETLPAPPRTAALTFGDYEVIGEIGEGGMGRVYKAMDRNLGRFVAIKVLRSTDPFECSRFRGEAELIAMLDHPNIIKIFAIETTPDGRPYLVLEFAEGGSLDRELAGHPQEPRRAAELTEALARAVQFAHEKGVIHRDLKPANVLRGKDKTLKLTDFGLAKELEVSSGMTPSGAVMGTPSYMAPEQAEGKVKQLGPVTDVYGLGAILYEALTGRPPFRGVNMVDTLEQVRWAEPAPPSRLAPRLPRDLSTICLKCLQKSPGRRYQTAAALADDLRRWLNGETIAARPAPSWERLVRQVRRRPWEAATVAASVLLVALFGAGLVLNREQQREKETVAARQREKDAADERLHLAETEATRTRLAEKDASEALLRERGAKSLAALAQIRQRLVKGDLKAVPGLNGLYSDLAAYYKQLIGDLLSDPKADRVGLAQMTSEVGDLAVRCGQFDTAEWAFGQAQTLYAELAGRDPKLLPDVAEAQTRLARVAYELGREALALELAADAAARWERVRQQSAGPDGERAALQLAEIAHLRGEVYSRQHKLAEAARAYNESIDRRRQVVGVRSDATAEELRKLESSERRKVLDVLSDLGRGYGYLGDALLDDGKVAAADQAYWNSHRIRERIVKALEPVPGRPAEEELELEKARFQFARSCMNLASFQCRHQAYATADEFTQKALALREALVRVSPNNADYKLDLCSTLNQVAEFVTLDAASRPVDRVRAGEVVARAIEVAASLQGDGIRVRETLAESFALQAELMARSENPEAAAPVLRTALDRFDRLREMYPDQPGYQFRYATLLALRAKLEKAGPADPRWQNVLKVLELAIAKHYRGEHPDTIRELPAFEPIKSAPEFQRLLARLRS
ncbi:serine/threonine-protein kinase [Frigoriglobus tundricola]|uniref:Protein kinase domain-containing protein n=1 Tax=Frigoriglobus tundricola TaxID=2774151 RepID=A0A6M5YWF8_9BACT|nr:serine/threonine-protein kinase [Frigoriglobus tundricola]QJW97641.1 hypothetical protein FTUN_5218 [Frigoriglobus tundricola]